MSTDISAYLGNKVIRWIAGNAFPSAPANPYMALFNNGSEVTTTVRAAGRVAISFAEPAAGTDTDMVSDTDTDFGPSDGAATIDEVRIYDASSAGNLLFSKALAGDATISVGETVKVVAGDLTLDVS